MSTLAGGAPGYADGTGAAARFASPRGIAADASGNVDVADTGNHRIRVVTPAGVVTTLAGSGAQGFADGAGAAAMFNGPTGIAVGASGDLFVADAGNHRIRRVTPSGVVTTLAGSGGAALVDGPGAAAAFNAPTGIALDPAGNVLVADKLNRRIRRVTAAGVVSTLNVGDAGASGKGAPVAVAVLPSGVVFAEAETHLIGTLSTAGSNSVLAGSVIGFADGPPASARFQEPSGLAVDPSGNLLVADTLNHGVRVIDATTLWTTTLAGTGLYGDADGTAVTASLAGPRGVAVGASGIVYVADAENARIRTILPPAPLPKGELEVTWTVAAGLDAIGSIAPITYTANANAPGHAAASCTMIRVYSAQGARIGCVIVGLASGVSYGVQVAALRGYTKGIPSPPLTGVPN